MLEQGNTKREEPIICGLMSRFDAAIGVYSKLCTEVTEATYRLKPMSEPEDLPPKMAETATTIGMFDTLESHIRIIEITNNKLSVAVKQLNRLV